MVMNNDYTEGVSYENVGRIAESPRRTESFEDESNQRDCSNREEEQAVLNGANVRVLLSNAL